MGKEFDFSHDFIGRVVNLRPLFIEILASTTNLPARAPQQPRARPCEIMRVFDVRAGLQSVLPQLRFNDLVIGKSIFANGGISKEILTELRKISGVPPSLPGTATGTCANAAGTLIDYRGSPTGSADELLVTNDLNIHYWDARGDLFEGQKVGQDDLNRLMQSFADSKIDEFPGRRWSTFDQEGGRATFTLVCARTQSVLVDDHRPALAPVLANLEHIEALAVANTSLVLSYRERRPITFIEWPLSNIALDQVENLKHQADYEEYEAQRTRRPVREIPAATQPLPPEFLANLPAGGLQGGDEKFVRSGARIFVVTRIPNVPAARRGTIRELMVFEIPAPENARVRSALKGLIQRSGEPINPDCAMWQGFNALLWPGDADTSLQQVPAAGKRITVEEYLRHRVLYEKIFNRCGNGVYLIQGRFLYEGVQLRRIENAR